MNGSAPESFSVAIMHGELRRMFLAAAIVLLIGVLSWAIQEFGLRQSAPALGWTGVICLGIGASFAVILIIALI